MCLFYNSAITSLKSTTSPDEATTIQITGRIFLITLIYYFEVFEKKLISVKILNNSFAISDLI